jgi:hypothetical protein
MKKNTLFLLVALIILIIGSCKKDSIEAQHPLVLVCDSAKAITFNKDVKPIIDYYCGAQAGCHSNGSASGGVQLESYEGIKNVVATGLLLKAIKHESSVVAMPKGATKLDDCTIYIIEKWINGGYLNN